MERRCPAPSRVMHRGPPATRSLPPRTPRRETKNAGRTRARLSEQRLAAASARRDTRHERSRERPHRHDSACERTHLGARKSAGRTRDLPKHQRPVTDEAEGAGEPRPPTAPSAAKKWSRTRGPPQRRSRCSGDPAGKGEDHSPSSGPALSRPSRVAPPLPSGRPARRPAMTRGEPRRAGTRRARALGRKYTLTPRPSPA
jgi:hypothetical protein